MKRAAACLAMMLMLFTLSSAAESVTFVIPSAYSSRAASLPMEEGWFTWDSQYYNHGLARLSLGMAVSAFPGTSGRKDAGIRAFLTSLGFGDVETAGYAFPGAVRTAAARRIVGSETVVAFVVGPGDNSWEESLNLGVGAVHQGFSASAETAAARLRDYAARHSLRGAKYWLAGFGGSGAVIGLAAERLIRDGFLLEQQLYAYTFASPRVSQNPVPCVSLFSIVSPGDALALLPPAAWGYARPGRTLALPSARRPDAAALFQAYAAVLRQFSADGSGEDFSGMADAALREAASRIGSRDDYRRLYQTPLTKLLSGRLLNAAETIRVTALISAVSKAVRTVSPGSLSASGAGALLSAELHALYLQHDPAVYAAWLLSLPDGNVLFDQSSTLTEGI